MHLAIAALTVFLAWRWADWRNWEKYHATMLFMALGNLIYNLTCANFFLWRFTPEPYSNHCITELLYTLIVFPGTVILFLSNYPDKVIRKLIYYAKWIGVYIGVEMVLIKMGLLVHNHGWSIWYSLAFDCMMFPLLYLHHKRPLYACVAAAVIGTFIVIYFNVPVELPVEMRK